MPPRFSIVAFHSIVFVFWLNAQAFAENEFQRRLNTARSELKTGEHFSFLANLSEKELPLIATPLVNRVVDSWEEFRERPFSEAWKGYPGVMGGVGEIYLNARARELVKGSPHTEFVSSAEYNARNLDGGRPDGLLVRRVDGGVTIESCLESKMGGVGFAPEQLYSYLRVWQRVGLTMPDGTHFPSEQIKLRVGEATIDLAPLNLKDPKTLKTVEAMVTLFTTSDPSPDFKGKVERPPFSGKELVELSQRYVAHAWLGSRSTPERVTKVIQSAPVLPRPPQKKRSELKEPVIGRNSHSPEPSLYLTQELLNPPEATFEHLPPELGGPPRVFSPDRSLKNDRKLAQWIEWKLAFPREGDLFRYLEHHGGPMFAFTELLNDTIRKRMVERGSAPVQSDMQKWIAAADPSSNAKTLRSVVDIFLDKYGNQKGVAFLRDLKTKDHRWAAFFESNPHLAGKLDGCGSLSEL